MSQELLLKYLRQHQKDPTSRVFAPLADVYRKMGRHDEAMKICLEGLQHHPRYVGGRVALAHCYFDREKFDDALKEYEFCLAQAPDNLQAIRGAARCYQSLHQLEKAVRYYRMYTFLVPKDGVAREHLAGLESQLKMTPHPPPAAPKVKPLPVQLQLDHELESNGTFDHFRLSSLHPGHRPAQRSVSAEPTAKRSANKQIQLLFRLLRVIRWRRDRESQLDGARTSSA